MLNNKKLQQRYLDSFKAAVNDDLNTPQALAVMWDVLKDDELGNHDKYLLLLEFDRVFGLELGNVQEEKVPATVKKLAEERLLARKKKDWKKRKNYFLLEVFVALVVVVVAFV